MIHMRNGLAYALTWSNNYKINNIFLEYTFERWMLNKTQSVLFYLIFFLSSVDLVKGVGILLKCIPPSPFIILSHRLQRQAISSVYFIFFKLFMKLFLPIEPLYQGNPLVTLKNHQTHCNDPWSSYFYRRGIYRRDIYRCTTLLHWIIRVDRSIIIRVDRSTLLE